MTTLFLAASWVFAAQERPAELMRRAQRLESAGRYEEAAQIYEELARRAPNAVEVLNNLGVAYVRCGKYPQAVEVYRRALRLQPNSVPLLVNLGLAHFKGGQFSEAVAPMKRALAAEPGNVQVRTLLAMSYYGGSDFASASREFEKLVALQSGNPTLEHLLAQSYLWSGQYERLLKYLEELLRRSPDSASAHMLMGEALDGLDRTDQAIREFHLAAGLAAKQPYVHFALGYLYWKKREFALAEADFQREIENGGFVGLAKAYLADLALRRGESERALALATEALQIDADIRVAHSVAGVVYAQQKRYEEAEKALKAAIRLDPEQVDAHYRLAQVYQAQGKAELARVEREQVKQMQDKKRADLLHKISGRPLPLPEQ